MGVVLAASFSLKDLLLHNGLNLEDGIKILQRDSSATPPLPLIRSLVITLGSPCWSGVISSSHEP